MSITKRIALGTGKTLVATLISSSFGIATTFLLWHYLDLAGYGVYALVVSLITAGTSFLDLGLRNVIIADVASELSRDNRARAKEILWSYSRFEILLALLVSALVFISALLTQQVSTEFRLQIFIVVAVSIFFSGIVNIFTTFFYSHERFGSYALLQIGMSAFELILVYYLVAISGFGSVGAVIAFSLGILISLILTAPLVLKLLNPFGKVKATKEGLFWNTIKAHGKFSMGMSVVKPLADYAPLWILEVMLGLSAVALYSAAYKIFQFLLMFVSSLETVLLPMLSSAASQGKDMVRKIYLRAIKYNTLLSILLVIASYFIVPPLIDRFFPQYVQSLPLFQIMSLALIILGASSGQRSMFFAYKSQKELFLSFLATLIFVVTIGAPLTYLFGDVGMVSAFIISQFLALLVRQYFLMRIDHSFKIVWKEIFSFDEFDKRLLMGSLRRITWAPQDRS